MQEDWVEAVYLDPPKDLAKGQARDMWRALEAFLTERGLARRDIYESDLRIDKFYMGPGKGCATRVMIKSEALRRHEPG